ncbi:MAG TPA: bifunctional phosphopantothenoylcysteine decarboxylase/phosphopantothenate--cysteine ligase CoaBC [Actinomycetota bacterium]|nr:bifunctional phosphopantothenoylcysteine decarboxylase/phosphopantothenate--cysteine ligase CoaBC [Actinomycetota bacterium]
MVLAGRRVLLGISGGIAAYKAAYLARVLRERGAEVQAVMTPAATRFVGPDTLAALTGRPAHSDVFESPEAVLHVRLAREAEVAVVAPATANVIARLALGLADDLLTSTLLEFTGPLVVAPAMHAGMYANRATRRNLEALRDRGAVLVGPEEGPLAAGDEGMGRMAEPPAIADAVELALEGPGAPTRDLEGRTVIVTAGPTREPIDAVRYLGNRSSGKMGFAVAEAVRDRGGRVVLVTGPTHLPDLPGVEVVRVETTAQMRETVLARFDEADAVVKAAAVADFRPADPIAGKIKKEAGPSELRLAPTDDILAELGRRKGDRVLVGFAAETGDLEAEGRRKLESKNLDVVVVNEVGRPGTGFEADTNRALILGATGDDEPLREWTKPDLAGAICDRLAKLLA